MVTKNPKILPKARSRLMEPDLKPFELDSEVAASHLGQCAGTTWVLSKGFKMKF